MCASVYVFVAFSGNKSCYKLSCFVLGGCVQRQCCCYSQASTCVVMYMCIHIYVYMCIYIFIYTYVCVCFVVDCYHCCCLPFASAYLSTDTLIQSRYIQLLSTYWKQKIQFLYIRVLMDHR